MDLFTQDLVEAIRKVIEFGVFVSSGSDKLNLPVFLINNRRRQRLSQLINHMRGFGKDTITT